jgi:DNA-binding CsgD family transcriptional regulator
LIVASDQIVADAFMGLTAKQCQVLDLLIQHKTSKEISRMLGISPHTVDQRIMLARAKLHAGTRSEVAQAYRLLRDGQGKTSDPDVYDQSIYGSPDIAVIAKTRHDEWREGSDETLSGFRPAEPDRMGTVPQQMAQFLPGDPARSFYHVLPEAFDGRVGTLMRLGAIAMITVCLTLVILGGLAMYSELSHMLDG